MKIALISDIHGNFPALEAVYHSINEKGIYEIFNLGDSLYGPLWSEETAQFLLKNNIKSIMGNQDEDLINDKPKNETEKYTLSQLSKSSIDWLKTLPKIIQKENITLFHGTFDSNREYLLENIFQGNIYIKNNNEILEKIKNIDSKYIGFGHSHLERILTINEKILINAGSVGLPAFSDDDPIHNIETFNNFAKYVLINDQSIEIINVEYDHKSSCKRARDNNRNDWYVCLKNGRVIE